MKIHYLVIALLLPIKAFAQAPLTLEQMTVELASNESLFFLTPAGQDLTAIDAAYLCFRSFRPRPGTELAAASQALAERVRPVFDTYGWPTQGSFSNQGHLSAVSFQPCVDPGALNGQRAGSFIFGHDFNLLQSQNPALATLFDIYSVDGSALESVSP